MRYSVTFPGGTVKYWLDTPFTAVEEFVTPANCIIITDNNIAAIYHKIFEPFKAVITIPAGEEHKNYSSILSITQQLLQHQAHRKTFVLGVGGGMITDVTGFIASVYMRGIPFGYAPTSLLAMADAAIGGKNGINIGLQKNLLGTITQPGVILFDYHFLATLPIEEWSNGFAEIIKYASLFDPELFDELAEKDIQFYKDNYDASALLIERCVDWKNKIIQEDERENNTRKLLNFGHTVGHAFETVCHIPHGHAVALGMLVACRLSEQFGLDNSVTGRLFRVLQQYNLPVAVQANITQLMSVLMMDKKRDDEHIDFIVLGSIGNAEIKKISFDTARLAIEQFIHAGDH